MKKKILIIRFSSIGDIVLTTPVIRCIKQQLPDCEVHYLTKKKYATIVKSNPHITKVWELDGNIGSLIALLRQEHFDFIVDLHNNLRSSWVKLRLGVNSASFDKLNWQKWILVNLKRNFLPPVHIVDRYLAAAKPLGVHSDGKGLDYFIPTADQIAPHTLPASHQQGYIAIAIGAQHATKKLPLDKLIDLCIQLQHPIVLLGGKEDIKQGNAIAAAVGQKVYSACGLLNLNQSASVLQKALKVITHDTGLMHIAAAFDKEIISVWGNTVPEFGMYPYKVSKSTMLQVTGLSCRPCSKIGYSKCPKQHFKCMQYQDLTTISKYINETAISNLI